MNIENNEQARDTLWNIKNSLENRARSLYNYGYKDGYAQGVKDVTEKIAKKMLEESEVEE